MARARSLSWEGRLGGAGGDTQREAGRPGPRPLLQGVLGIRRPLTRVRKGVCVDVGLGSQDKD